MSTDNPTQNTGDSWQSGLRQSSSYLGLGFQLAGTMLIYVLAGYLLDRWLDTEPWLLLAGAVIGMVAFFFQIFRLTRRLSGSSESERNSDARDS